MFVNILYACIYSEKVKQNKNKLVNFLLKCTEMFFLFIPVQFFKYKWHLEKLLCVSCLIDKAVKCSLNYNKD